MTSQAEDKLHLKRMFIVLITEYMLKSNVFRINQFILFQENDSIHDNIGFGNSARDVTGASTSHLAR